MKTWACQTVIHLAKITESFAVCSVLGGKSQVLVKFGDASVYQHVLFPVCLDGHKSVDLICLCAANVMIVDARQETRLWQCCGLSNTCCPLCLNCAAEVRSKCQNYKVLLFPKSVCFIAPTGYLNKNNISAQPCSWNGQSALTAWTCFIRKVSKTCYEWSLGGGLLFLPDNTGTQPKRPENIMNEVFWKRLITRKCLVMQRRLFYHFFFQIRDTLSGGKYVAKDSTYTQSSSCMLKYEVILKVSLGSFVCMMLDDHWSFVRYN